VLRRASTLTSVSADLAAMIQWCFDFKGVLMHTRKSMKPALFALAIQETVESVRRDNAILDIGREASRISSFTGLSRHVVAANLLDAGVEARLCMEIPSLTSPS
jgi:hypothetical protein